MNYKDRIQERVDELNMLLQDSMLRPQQNGEEIKFNYSSSAEGIMAAIEYRDGFGDLLVVLDKKQTGEDIDENMFFQRMYYSFMRYLLFAIDSIKKDGKNSITDPETGLPIICLTYQTFFYEGLERIREFKKQTS